MKRIGLAIVTAVMLWPAIASAHDVPDVVRISAFFRPEHDRMVVLVRVPANAFIDFLFPMFEDGGLDLTVADSIAAQGARVWIADILRLYEDGKPLPAAHLLKVRVSRMNDPFFNSFDDALSSVNSEPLARDAFVTQDTAAVDALLEVPIGAATSNFSFEPRFGRLGVLVYTTLTFIPPGGDARQFMYEGDPETFDLNPGRAATLRRFVQAGVAHYFGDTEYLVFALCVALVFSRVRDMRNILPFAITLALVEALALIVSLELMPSTPWIPVACGVLIAAATTYMGVEAIVAGDGRRIGLAVATGTIFGAGFWCSLQPILQFGGSHAVAAGLGFSAGVVLSELVALALVLAAVKTLLALSRAPHAAIIIAAAVAIHVSWRQMLDRADAFALVPAKISSGDIATFAAAAAAAIAIASGSSYLRRRNRSVTRPAI
jgi:hypothetical protein